MNYRLPEDTIAYIDRWHKATGVDREDVVDMIIKAYREAVGEPPKPAKLPAMPKARKKK